MAEPHNPIRWHANRRPSLPALGSVLLGLAALTGCAWTFVAGHAWLSLLSGGSRWLVASGRQPAAALPAPALPAESSPAASSSTASSSTAVTPAEPPRAMSAPAVSAPAAPLPARPPSARPPAAPSAAQVPGGAPLSSTAKASWPEELQFGGATCDGVFVYAVTLSEQAPLWSAVSLATDGKTPAKYARLGQRVGDWEVLAITDDWTGSDPVVWLARGAEVCRARLTGNPARLQAIQQEEQRRAAELQAEKRRKREERRRRRARRRR